jgi:hypothetical protein
MVEFTLTLNITIIITVVVTIEKIKVVNQDNFLQ